MGTGPDPEVFNEMRREGNWVHPHGIQQQQEWRDAFLAGVDKLVWKVKKTSMNIRLIIHHLRFKSQWKFNSELRLKLLKIDLEMESRNHKYPKDTEVKQLV